MTFLQQFGDGMSSSFATTTSKDDTLATVVRHD